MNPLLLFGGMFILAVIITAVISRFSATTSLSEEEKQRRREAGIKASERNRKVMQWIAFVMVCVAVVIGAVSWFSHDPSMREPGLYLSGGIAFTFLTLWAKTRDDGLNPQLQKMKPNKAVEPTIMAVTDSAAQPPRQP